MGIETGEVNINFGQLMKNKDSTVTGLTSGIEYLFKKNGVDYIKGWGKFNSATGSDIEWNDGKTQSISADKTIIATGSEPASLPKGMLDIDERYVVTSTGALDLPEIPKSMIVVGGGVIGLEMGSVYQRLGCQVTVIQHTERICPFLDIEISKAFQKTLKKQGLQFKVNTRLASGVNNKDKGVSVTLDGPKGQEEMTADVVLLSIGRKPFTEGLNLGSAGLSTNERGQVPINKTW